MYSLFNVTIFHLIFRYFGLNELQLINYILIKPLQLVKFKGKDERRGVSRRPQKICRNHARRKKGPQDGCLGCSLARGGGEVMGPAPKSPNKTLPSLTAVVKIYTVPRIICLVHETGLACLYDIALLFSRCL